MTVLELGQKVQKNELTWKEAVELFNKHSGENITPNALKKRFYRLNKPKRNNTQPQGKEYETIFGDGSVEAEKIINLPPEYKDNPNKVLELMGYNPNEWQVDFMTFSNWQMHTREQDTKELYSVKFKIRPKEKNIDPEELYKIIEKTHINDIKPYNLPKRKVINGLDKDKFSLLTAIELHLGKEAREFDVGEDYNLSIAKDRFEKIILETIENQLYYKADKLYYGIGNDFFNIDTPQNTTTKGTPQQGGISSYELFDIGLLLQIQALLTLREHYNEVECILVQGNHANTLEYSLIRALEQRFHNDNIIKFNNDYKHIQAFKEGNTSIFMSHGEKNYARLVDMMSSYFHKIYGETENRYVMLGHLHHKQRIDELKGFTVFRLSSPSVIDRWHFKEGYMSKSGQEIFTFDKNEGLINTRYINFEKVRIRK